MLTHVVYTQVVQSIDHSFCARLPRDEVLHRVTQMIGEFATREGLDLPKWEIEQLTRQLIHDLPSLERGSKANWKKVMLSHANPLSITRR
jgi:hypothetical protein